MLEKYTMLVIYLGILMLLGYLASRRVKSMNLDAMLGISIPKLDSNSCFASSCFIQVERF